MFFVVPINIVDDACENKKPILPAYDPQAPVTRRGVLPSFCNPGRTVEIRDQDLVTKDILSFNCTQI